MYVLAAVNSSSLLYYLCDEHSKRLQRDLTGILTPEVKEKRMYNSSDASLIMIMHGLFLPGSCWLCLRDVV